MRLSINRSLFWSGVAAAMGALLHVAAIFGGPAWMKAIGATEPVVRLAERGHWFPDLVCLLAALVLAVCALYAFSGAGLVRRVPLLKTGLAVISAALLLHGVAFIPVVLLRPEMIIGLYDGDGVNTGLVVTSAICLGMGFGYAYGLWQVRKGPADKGLPALDARGAT